MTSKHAKTSLNKISDLTPSERKKLVSSTTLLPTMNAATVISSYAKQTCGELDFATLIHDLRVQCEQVSRGDLQRAEAMLTAQAHSLDTIFTLLAQRAAGAEHLPQLEVNLRLALKAQSQSRATWETLAAIKNPPVIFAKQANFANGHQQVNNGTPETLARVGNETRPTKLLENDHVERLDTRATGAAIGADPVMATVGEVHRAKVGGG